MAEGDWTVYLTRCSDNTLYCGITTDVERRMLEHNCGRGARYTRSRTPIKLVYTECHLDRASASRREYEIKQLTRDEKDDLVAGHRRSEAGEAGAEESTKDRTRSRRAPM